MASRKLKPIEERDPYAASVLAEFDKQEQESVQADAARFRWLVENRKPVIIGTGGKFDLPDFQGIGFTWRRRIWRDGKPHVVCDDPRAAIDSAMQQTPDVTACSHAWRCVNDGKHGREERWECVRCGEQESR